MENMENMENTAICITINMKPIGKRIKVLLEDKDMYIMSEKVSDFN